MFYCLKSLEHKRVAQLIGRCHFWQEISILLLHLTTQSGITKQKIKIYDSRNMRSTFCKKRFFSEKQNCCCCIWKYVTFMSLHRSMNSIITKTLQNASLNLICTESAVNLKFLDFPLFSIWHANFVNNLGFMFPSKKKNLQGTKYFLYFPINSSISEYHAWWNFYSNWQVNILS